MTSFSKLQKEHERGAKPVNVRTNDDNEHTNVEDIHVESEIEGFPVTWNTIFFHFILLLASLYYPMLITNWGDPIINNSQSNFFQANWISFWVKQSAQWACMVLYLYAMIAPLICKKRDFS